MSAGRSIGNAVKRNRAKRVIRETIRPLMPCIADGSDLIFLARKPITNASYIEIESAMIRLLTQAQLLEKEHDK